MTPMEATRAGLGPEWRTSDNIHAQVRLWSPRSIKRSLSILHKSGEIERRYVPSGHPAYEMPEYRLPTRGQDDNAKP